MGVFQSVRSIPVVVPDLSPIARDLMNHFRGQGYEVDGQRTILKGWDISIHKGGMFKAILGLRSALKIELESVGNATRVKAGMGVFGQQIIPSAISYWVFAPVIFAQIWGLVRSAKLDDEAIAVAERSLKKQSGVKATEPSPGSDSDKRFCTECGAQLGGNARFCSGCGAKAP